MASYEDYLKHLGHKKCTEKTLMVPFENEVQELKEELNKQKQEHTALLEQKEKQKQEYNALLKQEEKRKRLAEEEQRRLEEEKQKKEAAEQRRLEEEKRKKAEDEQRRIKEASDKKISNVFNEVNKIFNVAESSLEKENQKKAEAEQRKLEEERLRKVEEEKQKKAKKKKGRRILIAVIVLLFATCTFYALETDIETDADNAPASSPANSPASSFTDSRDSKKYKTAKIGNQTWIAENLNYNADGSKCYDNKPENCDKYGRLYNWNTAMKACPSGWHLPSKAEWEALAVEVDALEFVAIPGGYSYADGSFRNAGSGSYWWSASESTAGKAHNRFMRSKDKKSGWDGDNKSALFSVRCIKEKE